MKKAPEQTRPPVSGLLQTLQLPPDLTFTQPVLTMVGTHTITIENYKSLRSLTETQIMIQTRQGLMSIQGKKLHIPTYHAGELTITGTIQQISFERK